MEKRIIYSAMRTPDGTLLESLHRHDFRSHTDRNGKFYMLDGGNDYIRCSMNGDEEFITLYNTDSAEKVRDNFMRYDNDGFLKKFKDVSNEWLDKAINFMMATGTTNYWLTLVYIREKQHRNLDLEGL